MFKPSDNIALVFLKKGILDKIVLCCLKATVPSCGAPFTKFL